MELRKLNLHDAAAQWEYTTALPADENGLTNPYHGVSFKDYTEKVLPALISYEHPVNMPDYCYFRDRCEMCVEGCKGKYPKEYQVSPTHVVSCYRCENEGSAK